MPVCQNPDPQPSTAPKMKESPKLDTRMRRPSIESVRIEDCDGPIPDNVVDGTSHKSGSDTTTTSAGEALCSDRAELIERIKRGECPTWVPTAAVSDTWLSYDIRDVHVVAGVIFKERIFHGWVTKGCLTKDLCRKWVFCTSLVMSLAANANRH